MDTWKLMLIAGVIIFFGGLALASPRHPGGYLAAALGFLVMFGGALAALA